MDSRYYPGVEADVTRLINELRTLFDQEYELLALVIQRAVV